MNNVVRIVIESSVQSAALAFCVGVILAAARIRSGAVRHAAWLAVLCGMMLMPVLSRVTPKVQVPIALPAIADADVQSEQLVVGESHGRATAAGPMALPRKYDAKQPSSRQIWFRLPWAEIGLTIYAAGLLFLLACLVPGWRAARQIARSCALVPVPATGATVCESELVNTPLTVGLLSPRIVLPVTWRGWTDTKLQAVLAHEAAHVKNRDALANLAACLNRCVFWFHPLAWWLQKKLATTAEYACDEAGARAVGNGREYARVLLDVAAVVGSRRRRYALVSAGMKGDGGLEERIDRILQDDSMRAVSPARKAIVAVACAIAIVAIPACRQTSTTNAAVWKEPIPEVKALIKTGGRPGSPEFASKLGEVRAKLDQSNDVDLLASNGRALVVRFSPNITHGGRVFNIGGEAYEAGRLAIGRALKLNPDSRLAREAQVAAEARFLTTNHWNPDDPDARKKLAYIAGEFSQSTDVNFLILTAEHMVSMYWPTTQGPAAGGEMFAVGKAAIERALHLDPNSIRARQLMLKIKDQELVVSLPENVWEGPLDSRRQAIQALPDGDRFRELSILAASAGDDAMRAAQTRPGMKPDPVSEKALWQQAGKYAQEALAIAPQAKDHPDFGTSLFRANMVAGMSALVAGDKASAVQFALKAMEAPPTEALRYPIVNARPWSNWHYPDMLVARLLRDGDRDDAADIAERYSRIVVADKDRWVAVVATIRKGDTPKWVQIYRAG